MILLPEFTKANPPYPNWKDYAENFREYSLHDQQKATSFNLAFFENSSALVHLIQNEYDRSKNAYVAIKLMPIFEENPCLWSVVHLLKSIPKNLTFSESLRFWRELSPEEFRKDIDMIAQIFSIVF